MFKKVLLFLCLSISIFAQDYKWAWITDIHIGYTGADSLLDSVVTVINSMDDVAFTIATGDIAEKGRNSELETAAKILSKLEKPYYIIPGNHDTKWSESGLTKFIDLWEDNKFEFDYKGARFVGLNSGIPWRGGGGHVAPEDLKWLKDVLEDSPEEVYYFQHHPLDEGVDNWYKVTNILNDYNVKCVFTGHGHANRFYDFNGIPGVMGRSTLAKGKTSFGFTLVESYPDTLKFFEVERDSIPNLWGSLEKPDSTVFPEKDTTGFIAYDASVMWQYDLGFTVSAEPEIANNRIFVADMDGIVYCFDSTGAVQWEYNAFGNIMSKPSYINGKLVVATVQGDLILVNADNGEQIVSIGFDEPITSQLITLEYKGNNQLLIAKQTDDKSSVVFGTACGKLYCYDLENLEKYWVNENANGMIETEPLYYKDRLYYGSWDGSFYCVDAKTGLLVWEWKDKGIFYYSPAACKPVTNGEYVFFTTPHKEVYALDLNLGKEVWRRNDYHAWESIGVNKKGNRIYVKNYKDKFHVVSARTGSPVKNMNLDYGLDTLPVRVIEADGKVMFGCKNGMVFYMDKDRLKPKKAMQMGAARVHSVKHFRDNIFVAVNMDGKIVMYKI